MATRLACVVDSIISSVQYAFIKDRQILDGPLMLDEIVRSFKKKRKKTMFFKVDIAKAYDTLSWDYLLKVMSFMGFSPRWLQWVRACLTSTRASILVNGSPTREFNVERGLRQDDPMAPFLCIIAMEGLNVALEDVKESGYFKGLQIGNLSMSHLLYADDVIVMGEWSLAYMRIIMAVFECFARSSSLHINGINSKLYGINIDTPTVERTTRELGVKSDKLPFIYLGVPISANMKLESSWKPILDKCDKRLSKWKAHMLSVGGRSILTTTVLGSIGTYYLSLFLMPVKIRKRLESIRARFFWGGTKEKHQIHWIKWDLILNSKEKGGLGLGSLDALNKALLYKWKWRFAASSNALWAKVIKSIHQPSGYKEVDTSQSPHTGTWSVIMKNADTLHQSQIIPHSSIRRLVGDGKTTLLWHDFWNGEEKLCSRFKHLYRLEMDKNCTVYHRWKNHTFHANWRRRIRGVAEEEEYKSLLLILSGVTLGTMSMSVNGILALRWSSRLN